MLELASTVNVAFIDGIGFDPFFRGFLSVLTGVVVLMGSVYLLVATNIGARHGMVLSLAGLTGWMFLMGIVWTIYGIGWRGATPVWHLSEINIDEPDQTGDGLAYARTHHLEGLIAGNPDGLPTSGLGAAPVDVDSVMERLDALADRDAANATLTTAGSVAEITDADLAQHAALVASRSLELDDWRYLVASDGSRGEAQASVDAFLVSEHLFAPGEYLPRPFGAFILDGKPVLKENASMVDRVVHTFNETVLNPVYSEELMAVQVQAVVRQATLPGQPPPVAQIDPDAPLVTVIMERDRGGPVPQLFSGLRFTPAMFTLFNGLIFAVLAWNLHLRDRRTDKIRAAAA